MDQKEIILTPLQGDLSVYRFLYLQNKSLEIQNIKEFLADGGTADPAAWHDWLNAVEKAIEEKEIPLMQLKK